VLARDLSEPSPPWKQLYAAGGVGRTVEVPRQLDEVWSCERHADELVSARRAFIRLTLWHWTTVSACLTIRPKPPHLLIVDLRVSRAWPSRVPTCPGD
jgi:hypothetical protein